MPQIGDMTHQIEIQANTPVTDDLRGREAGWAAVDTVWAAGRSVRAFEQLAAGAMGTRAEYVFTIWARADVTTSHRLRYVSGPFAHLVDQVLEIQGVQDPDGTGCWLALSCGGRR